MPIVVKIISKIYVILQRTFFCTKDQIISPELIQCIISDSYITDIELSLFSSVVDDK